MIVSDASAILALIRLEPGSDQCSAAEDTIIGAVNHCEVITRLIDLGFAPDRLHERVAPLYSEIVPFDAEQSRLAAALRDETRKLGISLGDRACLALAKSRGLAVQTADRRMAEADVGNDIRLIR